MSTIEEQLSGISELLAIEPCQDMMADISRFIEIDAMIRNAEADIDLLKAQRDQLEALVFQQLDNANMQSVKTSAGQTVYRRVDEFMSINSEHHDEAVEWLKATGFADLFKESINSRTMTSALKEYRNDGGEIPTDLIKIATRNRIGIRRG